jgi:hypothetical protein
MTKLAEERDEQEDFELDDTEVETEAEDTADDDAETGSEAGAGVVVTIGEEAPPPEDEEAERAPEWVRDLRKQYREEKRRNKELEQQLATVSGAPNRVAELGKKPTLEAADYDTDRYEKELAAWYERKRGHDEAEVAHRAEHASVQRDWQQKLEGYHSAKAELKVKDYELAEDVVQDTLSVTQQGMILQGAENPALLVYALGKNPKRAKELASIKDPVKFAFAVAKLETQLKVTTRKAASKPEPRISGTGRVSGTVDSNLERLRAEAERTGNYSKVTQYKKQRQSA